MELEITFEYEAETGRWLADIEAIPGVTIYGNTQKEAAKNVKKVALQAILLMLEDGELSDLNTLKFKIREPVAA